MLGAHPRFGLAPLTEMVVEVRWAPQLAPQNAPSFGIVAPQIMITLGNSVERLFEEFGQRVADYDFVVAERLIPLGVPLLPYQPTYRYRRRDASLPVLFHIGPGIFSAHAVPPYKTWHEFSRDVQDGLVALREANGSELPQISPHTLVMRYIDVFSDELLAGLSPDQFISQILGVRVEVPEIMHQHADFLESRAVQVGATIAGDIGLIITVAQSVRNGEPAVLMDWVATINCPPTDDRFDPNIIMDKLSQAHDGISNLFMGFTERIRDRMQPVQEEFNDAD